jgi:hypothetical protein
LYVGSGVRQISHVATTAPTTPKPHNIRVRLLTMLCRSKAFLSNTSTMKLFRQPILFKLLMIPTPRAPYIDVPLKNIRNGSRVISETSKRNVNHQQPTRSSVPVPISQSGNWSNTQRIKHNDYDKHPKNSEQTPSASVLLGSVPSFFLKSLCPCVLACALIRVHSRSFVVKYSVRPDSAIQD